MFYRQGKFWRRTHLSYYKQFTRYRSCFNGTITKFGGNPIKAALTTFWDFKIFDCNFCDYNLVNLLNQSLSLKNHIPLHQLFPPNLVIVPSIKTTSIPSKLFVVAPYLSGVSPPRIFSNISTDRTCYLTRWICVQ